MMRPGIPDRLLWLSIGMIFVGVVGLVESDRFEGKAALVTGHLAAVLVAIGIVELLFHYFVMDDILERATSEFEAKLHLPLEKFHETRNTLPPLKDSFKGVRSAWFAWHTGSVQAALGDLATIHESGATIRLILTHPHSRTLSDTAKISSLRLERLQENICEVTRLALREGIEVRWWDGSIGASMNIGNPKEPDAFAIVEVPMFGGQARGRPSFHVSRQHGASALLHAEQSFEAIWQHALPPDLTDPRLKETEPLGPARPENEPSRSLPIR